MRHLSRWPLASWQALGVCSCSFIDRAKRCFQVFSHSKAQDFAQTVLFVPHVCKPSGVEAVALKRPKHEGDCIYCALPRLPGRPLGIGTPKPRLFGLVPAGGGGGEGWATGCGLGARVEKGRPDLGLLMSAFSTRLSVEPRRVLYFVLRGRCSSCCLRTCRFRDFRKPVLWLGLVLDRRRSGIVSFWKMPSCTRLQGHSTDRVGMESSLGDATLGANVCAVLWSCAVPVVGAANFVPLFGKGLCQDAEPSLLQVHHEEKQLGARQVRHRASISKFPRAPQGPVLEVGSLLGTFEIFTLDPLPSMMQGAGNSTLSVVSNCFCHTPYNYLQKQARPKSLKMSKVAVVGSILTLPYSLREHETDPRCTSEGQDPWASGSRVALRRKRHQKEEGKRPYLLRALFLRMWYDNLVASSEGNAYRKIAFLAFTPTEHEP